jgi:1-deoxy-D-xylulose-5-phosphate reductoisomerase
VLNAANEVAVSAFLAGRIGFLDIAAIVETTLASRDCGKLEGLPHILAIDAAARRTAHALIGGRPAAAAGGI